MMRVPHDPNELLAIVDGGDNVVGKVTRHEVHSKGFKHREASVLIVNLKGEILLQKRRDNGKLDYSVSGHFPHNQDYLDAAVRETGEELGLSIPAKEFVKVGKLKLNAHDGTNDRFVQLFEVRGDYSIEDMHIDPEEVESVKYYPLAELRELMRENTERGGFWEALEFYLDKGK